MNMIRANIHVGQTFTQPPGKAASSVPRVDTFWPLGSEPYTHRPCDCMRLTHGGSIPSGDWRSSTLLVIAGEVESGLEAHEMDSHSPNFLDVSRRQDKMASIELMDNHHGCRRP